MWVTIFLHSRVKFNLKFNSLERRNIVAHGQLKENLYFYMFWRTRLRSRVQGYVLQGYVLEYKVTFYKVTF
jgi:hypothetical protein